jgi:acetylornithine deacetylase
VTEQALLEARQLVDPLEKVRCRLTATPASIKLARGTKAGHFAARGIPTVLCGLGDIREAHKPGEYAELPSWRAAPSSCASWCMRQ